MSASDAAVRGSLEHPVVIVAIPVYNEARFIKATLASLRAQTSADFRVVVSDNGSTDETGDLCIAACTDDPRLTYVRQQRNLGAAGNFQWLLDKTRSPYFMWLGGHDMLAPDYLARAVAALDADPLTSLVFADTQLVDEDGTFLKHKDGGSYHEVTGSPGERYRAVFRRIGPCEAVNNLFRRSALDGTIIEPMLDADKMLICQAAYRGLLGKIPAPLYLRRTFRARAEGDAARIARITAARVATPSRRRIVATFLRSFARLEPSAFDRLLLRLTLYRYYGRDALRTFERGVRLRLRRR